MKKYQLGWISIKNKLAIEIAESIKKGISLNKFIYEDQNCLPEPIIQRMFITADYDPVSEIEGLIKGLKIR